MDNSKHRLNHGINALVLSPIRAGKKRVITYFSKVFLNNYVLLGGNCLLLIDSLIDTKLTSFIVISMRESL